MLTRQRSAASPPSTCGRGHRHFATAQFFTSAPRLRPTASLASVECARAGAPRRRSRAPWPGLAKPEVAWGARRPRSRGLNAADARWVSGAGGGWRGRPGRSERAGGGRAQGSGRRRAESARGRGPGSPAASRSPGMGPGGRPGRSAALHGVDSPLPPLAQRPPRAVFKRTGVPEG